MGLENLALYGHVYTCAERGKEGGREGGREMYMYMYNVCKFTIFIFSFSLPLWQQDEVMEVDPPSLSQSHPRSLGTTPTFTGHMIRPKTKRSRTAEHTPSSSTLSSPLSTPPNPHTSLLTLLTQVFRVSMTTNHQVRVL